MITPTLQALGITQEDVSRGDIVVKSPIDGKEIGRVMSDSADSVERKIAASVTAFHAWRDVPAPRRGELIRLFGEELRAHKEHLGKLVTLEAGKITQESLGEVQEMIDIADFAVGLSRQLYGLTIASERPGHRMMEQWHPLGPVGIITAFNFPVAVWAWNAMLALVCGDTLIWKPSEKTPLTAVACHNILQEVAKEMGDIPNGVSNVVIGDASVGQAISAIENIPLVSATGSVRMGRAVAEAVARRLGRTLLELGG